MRKYEPAVTDQDLLHDAYVLSMGRDFCSDNHRLRWMARVSRNKRIDIYRQVHRRYRILRSLSHVLGKHRYVVTRSERVHQVIDRLPEELAKILRMKLDRMSDKDIAISLWNDASDAARVRVRRLREKQAFPLFRKLWDDLI